MSLDRFFKQWDVRYGIPRPASALHLDSYQAGLRLLRNTGEGIVFVAAGGASAFIWRQIGEMLLRVDIDFRPYIFFVAIGCLFIGLLEASTLAIPYYRITQRVAHGSARWADVGTLKESGLAFDNRQALPPGALRIGRLTRKYDLALPFKQVLCHLAIFGPPGSGKSSSFFMSMARDWAKGGSAIFMDPKVQWGIFKKADREKTQGGVYIGLGTKLAPLRSPHAMAVMQSVTEEERERGVREIDLYHLRKPGTGIYVVVPEGDATRYKIALSILFGLAASITRKTSDDENGAPVLLALDEAGNIPLHNLSEALGVGRGRRCGIVLGYQNIGQLYKQHGRDGAQAILGSIGTMVFLPGLDAETAQYAAKRIGRTTVLQHSVVDATGDVYDHDRLSEAGRDLLDAAELRQMPEHRQAVAIIGSAPPVKFGFPPCGKSGPLAHPLPREIACPVSLVDAEEAFAIRKADGVTAEPPSGVGAGDNGFSSGSREGTTRPDRLNDARLPLFDQDAESSSSCAAEETLGPAEQIPFDWDVDSSGARESIDSLIDSLLPFPPSTGPKGAASPPHTAPDSVDTDDDVNSTLGGLSVRDFGGASGTRTVSGREAAE